MVPAPTPLDLKEKLKLNLELGHHYVSELKWRFKPLTGSPPPEQAVSHSHIQVYLCQQNCQDGGPHVLQYNSAMPSLCRMALGPEHGGEGDPISDPLLAQMMFGPMSMKLLAGSIIIHQALCQCIMSFTHGPTMGTWKISFNLIFA